MALLNILKFFGRRPVVDDAVLPDGYATVAENCRLQGNKLKPLRDTLQVQAKTVGGTLESIYWYAPGSIWCEWTTDVDATPSQIGSDSFDRLIFTGDGAPKITYNSIISGGAAPYPFASYLLGVPPPGYVVGSFPIGVAPGVAVTGTPDDVDDPIDSRFYVVTCVDNMGSEGQPSPPSVEAEWQQGQAVDVTIPAIPAGNYNIASYRVYRTSTGSSTTEFLYVGGGSNFGGVFQDTTAADELAEVLPTENYDLPSASMIGITAMAGGYLAGHFDNVLCFSPIGQPQAWPVSYQINTKTDIVGIAPLDDNSLLVTTKERPYVATGIDPASMTLTELNILQACTSKRSVADVGTGVVYASPDGLVFASKAMGTSIITAGIFSREDWQTLNPATMKGFVWEGLYFCFYDSPTPGGFIINPNAPDGGIMDVTSVFTAAHYDAPTDILYVAEGSNIKKWDAATTYLDMRWRSKTYEMLSPTWLGVLQVLGDSVDEFDVELYVDGVLDNTYRAVDGEARKMRGGYRGRKFQIEIKTRPDTTGGSLHALRAATRLPELR